MIEDPPLLTIRRNFPRPRPEQVAALTGVPTGQVVDCLDGRGALDGRIKPIDPAAAGFCGVALPCHAGPADNLAVFGALDAAQPSDVILIGTDGFTATAVIGDLVHGMLRNRGVAAVVTDGYVRDIVGLRAVGLPCFCAGVTPNSPARNGPGTVGLPVTLGDVTVAAGDLVVGDLDGVVVVPLARVDAVIARLETVRKAEAELEAKVKAGLELPDFVKTLLASDQVREID
ncbi:MAG: 4-hydroxy-4-methyl-2-oxoglutarate aldolase [Kiloniellales bacterium]|nr:4-hydroxy-4-methyl-2-oxoglutarate aldolase [Kiloniellales bacterium]